VKEFIRIRDSLNIEKVCEDFLGLSRPTVEKTATVKKGLMQELEEGFNQIEFKSKVKKS